MQRFFDKLIGYVRPIEVAGVDVVDAEPDNFTQDGERTLVVCGRPEYMRPSDCMAPYPVRVRFKSSPSLNVPPGSAVDFIFFLLIFIFDCCHLRSQAGVLQWHVRP